MTDQEAKELVMQAIGLVKKATSINEIEAIVDIIGIPAKNRLNPNIYPPIKFNISIEEISNLKDRGFINDFNTFSTNLSSDISDPLTKLLYSIVWKNGDLQKVRHIINGLLHSQNVSNRNSGLVFYQFGKFLSNGSKEPIVDQHVLRAFAIYQAEDLTEVKRQRKLSVVSKKHIALIEKYIKWVKDKNELHVNLLRIDNYTYHLDKVLFALGKTVKSSR